jgi:hypothetical protein
VSLSHEIPPEKKMGGGPDVIIPTPGKCSSERSCDDEYA